MTHEDPVLARLAELPEPPLDSERARRTRAAALVALRPRAVHPVWVLLVAGGAASYLASALYFTLNLF